MGPISTSLKVVSIAVSFLADTKRSATFLLNIDNLLLVVPLAPPVEFVPMEGTAFTASSLVTLPSFPVPTISAADMPFSANIFLAAGEAVPVA